LFSYSYSGLGGPKSRRICKFGLILNGKRPNPSREEEEEEEVYPFIIVVPDEVFVGLR
jgi:hypothetical protein